MKSAFIWNAGKSSEAALLSMDIFFQDQDEVRLPPEQVRLIQINITPLHGSDRVKIYFEITPFIMRPNIEITISNAAGKVIAHSSILETMLRKLEITMHLRDSEPGHEYTIESTVYYQKLPEPSNVPVDVPLPDPMIVDRHITMFILPSSKT
jgi:hypothetical protein